MNTEKKIESRTISIDKLNTKVKLKSLRPMRSMVAVRSFRPKTDVANLVTKANEQQVQEKH